jgi:alanyl aminopeptidase
MKLARLLPLLLLLTTTLGAEVTRLDSDVAAPMAQSVALTVDPRKDDYTGSTTVDLQVKKTTSTFLLNAEDMTITSMTLDKGGALTHAKGKDGTVQVTSSAPLKPGKYSLKIRPGRGASRPPARPARRSRSFPASGSSR